MPPTLTAAALIAGKKLFENLTDDLYELIKKQTGKKLDQWNTTRKISTLYRKIGSVREVKTIWQVDKPVDLLEFYCDSHVIINEKRKRITSLSDFETSESLVIEGIAGQGKSIFLRYLCASELARANAIPIFLELRRVDTRNSVKDRVIKAFQALGLTVDDGLFKVLADSGKVILLLDAFDELPEELKNRALTEIEDLILCYPSLRIIATTRPNQSIQHSRHFHVIRLDKLRKAEYKEVILKIGDGSDSTHNLINHIQSSPTQIKPLLTTPLMVTLLVILYKSHQDLPNSLSEFYDALFITLMQRHDGSKAGFTRKRRTSLDDMQYREVFEAICLISKKTNEQVFNFEQLNKFTRKALENGKLTARSASVLADIVEITCLILKEGTEYRFIHKTVQEYYAAYFVTRKPDDWAKEFYSRCIKQHAHELWKQELNFLEEIDEYRIIEHFILPSARQLFDAEIDEILNNEDQYAKDLIKRIRDSTKITLYEEVYFAFDQDIDNYLCGNYMMDCFRSGLINPNLTENVYEQLTASGEYPSTKYQTKNRSYEKIHVPLSDFLKIMSEIDQSVSFTDFSKQLDELNRNFCNRIFRKIRQSVEKLELAKDHSLLDELI